MLTLKDVYSLLYADIAASPLPLPTMPWGSTGQLPASRIHTSIVGGESQRISTEGRNSATGLLVLSVVTPDEPTLIDVSSSLLTRYLQRRIGGIWCGSPRFRNLGIEGGLLRGDVRVTFEEVQ